MDEKEKINIHNAKFILSAVSYKDIPNKVLPEIVLAGKSNIGKSSFVNTILNRKNIAKTSNKPGKTRQMNIYNIDEKIHIVDLPGYGFSHMSKKEEENVAEYINNYFKMSKNIALVILFLDIRHKVTDNDIMMIEYLEHFKLPYIILMNKVDKIAVTKIDETMKKRKEEIEKETNIKITNYYPFSSIKKIYTENIWKIIEEQI